MERKFRVVKELPPTERIVGILEFKGKIIVATDRAIYAGTEVEDLKQQEFQVIDEE